MTELMRRLQESAMDHSGTRLGDVLMAALAALAAQQAEPVQRLSDERIRALVIDYGVESLRVGSEEARYAAGVGGSNYRASFLREKRAEALKRVDRAIESALQPAWRGIESAPKDFVTVFDGWNGERVPNVSWGHPTYSPKGAFDWCAEEYEQHYGYVTVAVKGLTHWMPLPPAPKATP